MLSGELQKRGYEVVPLEKYPIPNPPDKINAPYLPQSPKQAAAEFIRMVHEDRPDVMWAMGGGFHATAMADELNKYASNPAKYVSDNPSFDFGKGADKGFGVVDPKPLIIGFSDVAHIQIAMKQYGFPSIYAPTFDVTHDFVGSETIERKDLPAVLTQRKESLYHVKSTDLLTHKFFQIETGDNTKEKLDKTLALINKAIKSRHVEEKMPAQDSFDKAINGEVFVAPTSMIANSLGTPWELRFVKPTILMLELMGNADCKFIDELDLMQKAGTLDKVQAIVFADPPESPQKHDPKVNQIKEKAKELGIPVFILPKQETFGHFEKWDYQNFNPIQNGTQATINLSDSSMRLGDRNIEGLEHITFANHEKRKGRTIKYTPQDGNRAEYTLKELFELKSNHRLDFRGKDLVVDLSGKQSCEKGHAPTWLQGLQSAGIFDNTHSVEFIVAKEDSIFGTRYIDYFKQQLRESGRNVGKISITNLNAIKGIDAIDLATTTPISDEVKQKARELGAAIFAKPPLDSEIKDRTEKSWIEKMASRTPQGSREV